MPREVKTHTRRTASGRTTTVRQHTRSGCAGQEKLKRKRGPNHHHAARLVKRSIAHGKRGRKAKAGAIALLAAGELVAWLTLSGTSFLLALIAGVLTLLSILLIK